MKFAVILGLVIISFGHLTANAAHSDFLDFERISFVNLGRSTVDDRRMSESNVGISPGSVSNVCSVVE